MPSPSPSPRGRERLLNPKSPEFVADPYPIYRELYENAPIWWNPQSHCWVATRFDDIQQILRDPRFGHAPEGQFAYLHGDGVNEEPVFANFNRMMLVRNAPDHTRLRKLVSKAFSARRVLSLRPRIEAIAHQLIDSFAGRGQADLMADFAQPLPILVICELLGVPEADRAVLIKEPMFSERILQPIPMTRAEIAEENAMFLRMRDYFRGLVELRRREPADDLISALLCARDGEDALSEDELIAMITLLFAAGHETTVNTIGNGLLALQQHPDQLALLRSDPTLLPSAVDELVRYDSPAQTSARVAFTDVTVRGVTIERGRMVICVLGAANRDPEVYPDPDRLDIRRTGIKPIVFGGGIHYCLGAQLAKLEARIAIGALLGRLSDLSIDLARVERDPKIILRGVRTLPACFTAAHTTNSETTCDHSNPQSPTDAHGPGRSHCGSWRPTAPFAMDRFS